MSDQKQSVLEVLLAHEARPTNSPYCICGWRPALMLNDTESDRGQHRGHVSRMVVQNMKTEEAWEGGPESWPMPEMVVTSEGTFHADGMTPLVITDDDMRAGGWRKVRRFVTEWEEV